MMFSGSTPRSKSILLTADDHGGRAAQVELAVLGGVGVVLEVVLQHGLVDEPLEAGPVVLGLAAR
jgi:hypothetical protein